MNEGSRKLACGSLWEMTNRARVITLIGAGGKTTCLQRLTREISASGYPVTATTTTKVYPEVHIPAWHHGQPPSSEHPGAYFWYSELEERSGKWLGFSPEIVDEAIQEDYQQSALEGEAFRHWVIEGDGAREHRLKCWAEHEPQIPRRSDCGVLVLAGSLWGQVLKAEDVHRAERCTDLLDLPWTEESVWRYLLRSPVFWPQYGGISWVILLNFHGVNIVPPSVLPEASEGAVLHNFSALNAKDLLEALSSRWLKLQEQGLDLEKRPRRLRLALGDAKEGTLTWFDLW
ncbi:selenium cofactor biosynthesis protein YqeC [Desulfosporosinus sp. PR]|uniref:selenium cofactor biosynthesis protein YqeC n=1 Tax=Candidatus Desulfosporosinus nitrosoreducens TaxID=3401928 RepID=UPI0027F345A8|nr:selenium cofactor biosynthesis protein YqeC [Desulfosporosinus sp. PR]MDQ7096978.1 selenium cofactor biosynthesis protein YqeC [Desulfosporosinus sp. PR]